MKNIINKKLKMMLSLFLCVTICAATIIPVFADDAVDEPDSYAEENSADDNGGGNGGEAIPEYEEKQDGEGQNLEPVIDSDESSYSIDVSTKKISFGTHTVGSVIDAQEFVIINNGSTDVNLMWKDVDPDNAFVVDMTHAQVIKAGESEDVHVSVATNKGAGSYSAVLQFADVSDPAYDDGVKVELSVTFEESPTKVKKIVLKPGSVSTTPGSTVDFYAEVEGEGDFEKGVNYSVKGSNSSATVIDGNGHLSIGTDEFDKTIVVMAESKADPTVTASANVEIKGNVYSVNISSLPGDGGEVTGAGTYKKGSTVRLSAYPKNGWIFDGWNINGDDVGGSATYTIENINNNFTAVAYFKQDYIRVKAKSNHDHMGYVEGDGYFARGETVTLKAVAEDGYKFSCWMEGKKKVSSDKKLVIKNVDSDREFKAVFSKDRCVVKVASCDETMGSVSGGAKVEFGQSVTIRASANKGYRFVKWICNDQKISELSEYTLKDLQDDITVVAIFEPEKKDDTKKIVTINAGTTDANGVITPSGKITFEEGKSINFTVTPKSGYQIAAIAVDGKQIQITNSFTISNVRGDHTVVAAFLPIQNANVISDEKKEQSAKDAQKSDINTASPVDSTKRYDENIMNMKDAPKKPVNSDESMDNDLDKQKGVLQDLNMTDEEAAAAIRDNAKKIELMRAAVEDESLKINVSNEMREVPMPVEYGDDALKDPEVANFVQTMCGLFTDDEMEKLVSGDSDVSVSISVAGTEEKFVPITQREEIDSKLPSDKVVGKYFFISITKTLDGVSNVVSELSNDVIVKVDIPDNIYQDGRKFSIARLHLTDSDKEVSVLEDLDDDPHTITFKTDRFSTYAIIYDGEKISDSASAQTSTAAPSVTPSSEKTDTPKESSGSGVKVILIIIGIVALISCGISLMVNKKKK